MGKINFAILATGNIANSMAEAVSRLDIFDCCAAASRSYERAKTFADRWEFRKACGSYEELVQDREVELVYVASPHSHHYQHAKLCLEHGKHVLLEKAFTVNAAQAEELIAQGTIGEVQSVMADFGAPLSHVERLRRPELAGGALLDLGVYPLNFALTVFTEEIREIRSSAVMSPEGVDHMNSITLTFENGKMAVLHSNMLAYMSNRGVIYGDKGYLEMGDLNNCSEIRVYDENKKMTACYPVPEQINGYEYEALACARAIRAGQVECEEMPHSETMRLMRILDTVREQWGFKLPGD